MAASGEEVVIEVVIEEAEAEEEEVEAEEVSYISNLSGPMMNYGPPDFVE